MRPLISIILPVYNVEEFLGKCLKSLEAQNSKEYEIVIVDDGSNDNSLQISQNWLGRYSNIRVYQKKNGGLSSARNYGLDKAYGEFIMFVDPDDEIVPYSLDAQINLLNKYNCDILIRNFKVVDANNESIKKKDIHNFIFENNLLSGEESLKILLEQKMPHFAWLGIFKRALFVKHNIRFPEGRRFEDSAVMYRLLGESKSVYFDNNKTYLYRQNRASIMHNVRADDAESLWMNVVEMENYFKYQHKKLKDDVKVYGISRTLNALIISYESGSQNLILENEMKKFILKNFKSKYIQSNLFKSQIIRIYLLRLGILRTIYLFTNKIRMKK